MNWGYFFLVAVFFSILLIITQRIIPKRRRMVRIFVVSLALLLMVRAQFHLENILAYLFALVISFLFWLLIGRYNPTPEDDRIKVYGLDD